MKKLNPITNSSWNNLTMLIKNKYGTVSKFFKKKYYYESDIYVARFHHWKRGVSTYDKEFTKLVKEFGCKIEREN